MPLTYPHLRPEPVTTLGDLRFESKERSLPFDSGEEITVAPDLSSITVGNKEIVGTIDGAAALATWLDIPQPFFMRLDSDLRVNLLNEMLHRSHERGVLKYGESSGVTSILVPGGVQVTPNNIIDVATRLLGSDASVVEVVHTQTQFALDAVLRQATLGDPAVGDLTAKGLRFSLNLAQNLSPRVSPYYYRRFCTNGASRRTEATKIDSRGQTVDEVLAELEEKARIAFSLVENDVHALYELRNEHVPHPERTLHRMAREHGLSERLRVRTADALPSMVEDMENVTMFDIINAVTHMANASGVKRGAREKMESFGSLRISQHVERCVSCASRLN